MSNGYSTRGVEEFQDYYGRGVRTNDVYPLNRDVDPRRYRGRDLNGAVVGGGGGSSGPQDVEDFVRSELSVRPGANLRVSSTGTWTFQLASQSNMTVSIDGALLGQATGNGSWAMMAAKPK